ncbi:MAG: TonB-dependent receptor [Flammeovirgaceae bacterium]
MNLQTGNRAKPKQLLSAASYLLLFFSLIIQFPSKAQGLTQTIRGKVIDSQSEGPVIGATVVILGSDPIQGASTDVDGAFRIEKVALGRHTIKISSIGYEDRFIPEVLVSSGKELVLNIKLKESVTTLEELVVTAAEQDQGKTVNEMTSVSALSFSVEETSRYAATFDDPARAALSFAGVRGGGDDVTNEIVIRGNSPKGLLWRMEGIEIPNPNHFAEEGSSAGGISMLSASMLANSDFFTGAFPSEYGNALSGVFDIHLRQGNNENREYAFQAGLLGVAMAAEGPFSKNGKASYLVNYRYSTLGLFSKLGINIVGDEEIIFQDLSFKLHFPTKKHGSFSIWGLGGASSSIEDANSDTSSIDYNPYNDDFRTKMGVLGLSHTYFLDKNTFIESKVAYSQTRNRYREDSLKAAILDDEKFVNTYIRGSVMLNRKFNAKNTLRVGGIYSSIGFDLLSKERDWQTGLDVTQIDDTGHTTLYQTYAQWQHRLNNNLTLNSGFHYTYLALNGSNSIEPRLGMIWDVSDRSSINAGIGVHSRIEPITVYLLQDEQGNQPNKNLELTKSAHFVLGYNYTFKNGIRFKTEAYYQRLFDVPVFVDTDPTTLSSGDAFSMLNEKDAYVEGAMVNEGTGTNYGIEMTVEKSFANNHYFMLTGSLYDSKYQGTDGKTRNTLYNGNYTLNAIGGKEFNVGKKKQNIISVNARFILAGGNRTTPIDLAASLAENRTVYDIDRSESSEDNNIYSKRLPDYMRVDFGIKYRKNKPNISFIWALNIQNVTGRVNVADEFFVPGRNQTVNGQTQFVPGGIGIEEQLSTFPNFSYRIEF